jgi:hypothetical protein
MHLPELKLELIHGEISMHTNKDTKKKTTNTKTIKNNMSSKTTTIHNPNKRAYNKHKVKNQHIIPTRQPTTITKSQRWTSRFNYLHDMTIDVKS